MMSYPILASHYGPDAAWFFGAPIWGLALVVCFMSATSNSWRVLSVAGGVIAFFMIFTTVEPLLYPYDNDLEVATMADAIASVALMALNFFCTHDKTKFPLNAFQKMKGAAWLLAAFFVFLAQSLVGAAIFLLVRVIFR